MVEKTALKTILVISIIGTLFSGFLSYQEIFMGSCATSFVRCGTFKIANLPACVYGLVMYVVVFVISLLGVLKKHSEATPTQENI